MAAAPLVDSVGLGEKIILLTISAFGVKWLLGGSYAIAFIVGAVVLQFLVVRRRFDVWKNIGIPGPPPTFWIGNLIDISKHGMHRCDPKWRKEYGSIFGVYMMSQPDLVVGDPDLIKKMLIKDFHIFTNRRAISSNPNWQEGSNVITNHMITMLNDDTWKNIRRTVTPAFTVGKMKHMTPAMTRCTGTLLDILKEHADTNEPLLVHELFGSFVLDVIAITAFAQEIDTLRNPDHLFVKYSKEIGDFSLTDPRILLSFLFPFTLGLLDRYFGYAFVFRDGQEYFVRVLTKIIQERRAHPFEKPDFLQLLLNSAEEKESAEEKDEEISHDIGGKKVKLTDFQIIAQSFLFLVAGYGTTAFTMSYCAYSLATNPEIQEKCRQEIEEVIGDEEITWDHVQNRLPYLESVIFETLRMYPIASRFDRNCSENYRLSDEITIPKGAAVSIPAYAIHHDPEIYPDPETFNPDRFSAQERAARNPVLFLSFGVGPRNCIGMRFAQVEMKLCLANILRKFRLLPCGKTENPPLKLESTNLLKPVNPIYLGVEEL